MLPPSPELGASLFEALLAIAVFMIGLGGGIFWLGIVTDGQDDEKLARHVGALTEALEAWSRDNWSHAASADTVAHPSSDPSDRGLYHTAWVVNETMQEGRDYTQAYYGVPWATVRSYVRGGASNLSPVVKVANPPAQDSCYVYRSELGNDEEAPCVWLEGDGDSGLIALFHLERRVRFEEDEGVYIDVHIETYTDDNGNVVEVKDPPLRAVVTVFHVYSANGAQKSVAELEAQRLAVARHLPVYFAGPPSLPAPSTTYSHEHLLAPVCRREWIGGSLSNNCMGTFGFGFISRTGFVTAKIPVRKWVNWDIRVRDLPGDDTQTPE